MIQSFYFAKVLCRAIAKEHKLKNKNDWEKFTKSKHFEEFKNVLPVNPESYYSKTNVMKRRENE